jgi:hypothetical protein
MANSRSGPKSSKRIIANALNDTGLVPISVRAISEAPASEARALSCSWWALAEWSSSCIDHSALMASIGSIAKMRVVANQAATRAAARSKIDAIMHVDIPGVLAPTKTC